MQQEIINAKQKESPNVWFVLYERFNQVFANILNSVRIFDCNKQNNLENYYNLAYLESLFLS